jgi:CRISPR system Cascade subunit CasA
MPTFNLIEEPWIPALSVDGRRGLASLRSVLEAPGNWRTIGSGNPVESLALYRLLLAICHRAIGPGDHVQRLSLVEAWPSDALMRYLETWKKRFDLFDNVRPFLQVPALRSVQELIPSPWTRIALDRASGNAKRLWDHSRDADVPQLDFVSAARILLAHLQFTPGGLVRALRTSGSAGPATSMLLSMPLGRDLGETLALSLLPQTAAEFAVDLPAWEAPAPEIAQLKAGLPTVPQGPAARYTWLSRAILYLPTEEGLFSTFYAEGMVVAPSPVPDPMSASYTVKGEVRNLLIREDRALWRDFHALAGAAGCKASAVLEHAAKLRLALDNYDPIDLIAGGLQPDQMTLVLWRLEERRISPRLLESGGTVLAALESGVQLADKAGQGFFAALGLLATGWLQQKDGILPSQAAVSEVRNRTQAMERFWGSLEPAYWRFVSALGGAQTIEVALGDWRGAVEAGLRAGWSQAADALGSDARALAAAASAHRRLAATIAEVRKG